MGTVPTGTGELRITHSRVVWMSGPVERSIIVSAPHRVAQASFSTSSSMDALTAELARQQSLESNKARAEEIAAELQARGAKLSDPAHTLPYTDDNLLLLRNPIGEERALRETEYYKLSAQAKKSLKVVNQRKTRIPEISWCKHNVM